MILTCPACETKYVVKDGAIPPAGRQVRCASCKHSWHQDPEPVTAEQEAVLTEQGAVLTEQESVAVDFGGPPQPEPGAEAEPLAEVPAAAEADMMVAGEPEPGQYHEAEWEEVDEEAAPSAEPVDSWEPPVAPVAEEAPDALPDERPVATEEEFVGYAPINGDDEPNRSRWPLLIGLIVLIAAAAAAFWFLAPPEWKARAGIAQANATPLQLMITTSDRQPLESGNELVAISGRVINPTDVEQQVPPIRAELRDKQSHALVHSWTIAPPARVLAPRSSASFNSAEVDVPKGGDELTVTLGG